MTVDAANALYRYFEVLYDLNRNLITLCGVDVLDNAGHYEKYVEEVIHAIPRLIPYTAKRGADRYEIDTKDGLLEFADEIPFIEGDYKNILQQHYDLLAKIKKIRNKFEHRMHGARIVASGSGSISLFDATYKVGDETFDLVAGELVAFAKDMNSMFSKIQKILDCFAYEQRKDDHPYYRRLIRYSFCNFNQIYESDLLRLVGKALLPF